MRIRIALGLLAALIACRQEPEEQPAPIPEAAGDWAVAAQADKTEIQVGEALTLDVTVRHPAGAEFLLATGENLAPFELVERVDEDSTNPMESRLRLRIAAYRLPGDITIPPLKVEYRDESGELASIETAPIPISLVTSLTPEVTDIHDIKDPVADIPVPGRWGRLWWLLAALLAAAMAYLLYRRFRKRQPELLAEPMPERLPPPEVEAEEALRKLVEARFLEMGKVREFYIALSEIMNIPQEGETKLDKILITSDLVKFARIVPPDEESNRMVPEGFRFIDQTKPRVVAPELVTPDGSVEAQP
jgi:hypothetical protein